MSFTRLANLPWPGRTTPPVTRRAFLSGLTAGSLVLASRSAGALASVDPKAAAGGALPFEPDLFLSIAPNGAVKILAHRSEMGTGIRTALPMVVADELGADWGRVEIVQALGDERLGSQNTDGSRSVRRFFDRMRVAGATARTMLEQAAAERWGVDPGACRTESHAVVHADTGRRLDFAGLVEAASALEVPAADTLEFKPASERKYIGRDIPLTDLDGLVDGTAKFGIDVRREGQLFAVVERPAVLGARVRSFEAKDALAVAGVVDVVEIPPFEAPHGFQPLGGVAVLANSTWAAMQGRRALKVEWEDSPHAAYDSAEYEAQLTEASHQPGKVWRDVGDVDAALAEAGERVHEADYFVPHLAHASMEPPCALAEVREADDGSISRLEVWAPTQNPQAAQAQLAATFGVDPSEAKVHVTLLGGGFGRKSKPDYIVEAALLSRQTKRPVHVTWSREDDIRNDYYHSVAAVHAKAALDEEGKPTAILHRSVFPTIASTFAPGATEPMPLEMGLGLTDVPWDVPNVRIESGQAEAHVRIGWLRSVDHIQHAFASCSFPDELAHLAGRDPYEYVMELLGEARELDLEGLDYPNHDTPLDVFPFDVGRLRYVSERAARLAGWGRGQLPAGRARGFACHRSFLSYCANVVEVEVSKDGVLSIPRVTVVIDAGTVVHPDRVRAQMEGATAFAASLAMYGEITAAGGRIQQSNFHDYPMTRIHDAPREVHVEIVASDDRPAGVGEVGVPPFAPALTNAIFAATGKRIRRLPLSGHDLSWS